MFSRAALSTVVIAMLGACAHAEPVETTTPSNCDELVFDGADFTVCAFDVATDEIGLFHTAPDGRPFAQFSRLSETVTADGGELIFAMNAGMYHPDRSPVGLYIEDGDTVRSLVRGDGPGNFQLLPNGVFWIDGGVAGVMETEAYAEAELDPLHATQSGPLLVLDGELHPAFREASDSLFIRNGVGVAEDGRTVYFAISSEPVNFHHFGRLFRDALETSNALFLDGKVSKLYAPELGRHDFGFGMGPIVGVIRPSPSEPEGE